MFLKEEKGHWQELGSLPLPEICRQQSENPMPLRIRAWLECRPPAATSLKITGSGVNQTSLQVLEQGKRAFQIWLPPVTPYFPPCTGNKQEWNHWWNLGSWNLFEEEEAKLGLFYGEWELSGLKLFTFTHSNGGRRPIKRTERSPEKIL